MVILETLEHAEAARCEDPRRGRRLRLDRRDAFRITDQDPEGMGAVVAMQER